MSDLYDADILLWSEHQATLLRRSAAGEPLNERSDWANIIEEMESVGRSEFPFDEGLLMQAIAHRPKAQLLPGSREVPSWLAAVARIPTEIDGFAPLPMPADCPYELDGLLREP